MSSSTPAGWIFDVELSRTVTRDTTSNGSAACYMEITATSTSGDPAIFVHQVEAAEPTTDGPQYAAYFSNVCGPSDYAELPSVAPASNEYLLYRTTTIKAFFRTLDELEYAWDSIKSDAALLIRTMKSLWAAEHEEDTASFS